MIRGRMDDMGRGGGPATKTSRRLVPAVVALALVSVAFAQTPPSPAPGSPAGNAPSIEAPGARSESDLLLAEERARLQAAREGLGAAATDLDELRAQAEASREQALGWIRRVREIEARSRRNILHRTAQGEPAPLSAPGAGEDT